MIIMLRLAFGALALAVSYNVKVKFLA